jgi:hypothetical protein
MTDSMCPRVNAAMLHEFQGRHVTLMGSWGQNPHDGTLYIKAPDGYPVDIVNLPPGEQFETPIVQVVGKVVGDKQLDVFRVIQCPGSDAFNLELYNKALLVSYQKFKPLFFEDE